ncbi:M12 family metallopeptidase [Pseudomonas marginalis]|nr:matrixin family metalloprotease [Pseudomonas marginalis]
MSLITPLSPNIPIHHPARLSDNTPPERAARKKRGVADISARWPAGIITVALDLKDKKSKALVVDALKEWAHHTPDLRFEVVDGKQGDIRVSDDENIKGNWSDIGTDALWRDKNEPTLHLDRTENSKLFRANALHEFGHALGLLHEHQHPQNTLQWNKQAVHDYFVSDAYPEEIVQRQILDPVSGPNLQITPYDPKSVMHYAFPAQLTENGHTGSENISLSKGDQEAIRRLYTPQITGAN